MLAGDIAFLVCYTGTATLLSSTSGWCEVAEPHHKIPRRDEVLSELHTSTSTCCVFKSLQHTNTHFQHLQPACQASRAFLDTLAVHATSHNKPELLVDVFALGTHLLSDQLSRALYTPEHATFVVEFVGSVPEQFLEKLKSYPIYKTYNFDAEAAGWGELVLQVRNNLSKSSQSFDVMMKSFVLDFSKVEDCVGLMSILSPSQLAALFSRTLSKNPLSPDHQLILIKAIMKLFSAAPPKLISNFLKSLYKELHFNPSQLSQLEEASREELLGEKTNTTRTINQLGSKGTGKWRDALYHTLLTNFILFPDLLLRYT